VECDKCNQVYCEDCVKNLNKRECPSCRQFNFNTKPNILVRRMISSIKCECPNECGCITTIGELDKHFNECPKRVYACVGEKEECKFEGDKQSFIQHLISKHGDLVVDKFEAKKIVNGAENEDNAENVMNDLIGTKINEAGREARLGKSGKYYCGGQLGTNCFCCNGCCGIDSGCNCVHCMKLDIKQRALPKGYFVNADGFPCRKGDTGIFYCGRKCLVGVAFSDGYCGPK
jgi:hypothetical protein